MRILAVEDERVVARGLRLQLNNLGYDVPSVASSKSEALDLVEQLKPDLVLMDIRLNGRSEGIEAAREIRDRFDIPVVFLTAHSDPETLGFAKGTDPFGYVLKPAQDRELMAVIEMAAHKHNAVKEMRARNRQQAAAKRLGLRALANLDLQSLMDEACTTVQELLEVDLSEVLELQPGGETLLLRAGVGWRDGMVGSLTVDVSDSHLGLALKSYEPSFLNDLSVEQRFLASPCDRGVASGAAIAIAGRHEPYGVLAAYSCGKREFKEGEVEFLQSVAAILGSAIERKRAEEALENANSGLRAEIERRQAAEHQLHHAQKMEALGVLAGGVAHDFNNLLTVISGYNEMLARRVQPELQAYVLEVEAAAERAKSLTTQLLALSRRNISRSEVLDLNRAVGNIEKMLRRIVGEDIEFVSQLTPDLAKVSIDPGQLDQIILNLVVNARDAMPGGGRLTIETGETELTGEFPGHHHIGVPAGRYVTLAVSDTGVGIDAETKKHLFEPFFTTKRDKGTGLGLSIVFSVVSQSGGEIAVFSEPGKGTVVKIFLPALARTTLSEDSTPVAEALPVPRGTETLLIAEDDAAVRQLICDTLRSLGYVVIEAATPRDAIRLAAQYQSRIDLILTDIIMPEINGIELASTLLGSRPEMKVLFTSGYANQTIQAGKPVSSHQNFLPKPFTPAILGRKVRQVLEVDVE